MTLTVNPRRRRRSRRRYRRNPGLRGIGGGFVSAFKKALPYAVAFGGARVLTGLIENLIATKAAPAAASVAPTSGIGDTLGRHAKPIAAVALVGLALFASKKVRFLRKHQQALLVGTGVNAILTLVQTYLPSVAGQIGMGADYQEMGVYPMNDYIDVGDYIDTGDYLDVGDGYQEMGDEYELGSAADDLQIGTGIGSPRMLAPVPHRSMVGPVPNVPMVAQVPAWAPAAESSLYTGIFGNRKW